MPALNVEKLFPLPVSVAAILNLVSGRRREMSGNVDSVISMSGLVENVGAEVETASIYQAVSKLLPLQFLRPPSWICGFRLHVTVSAVGFLDLENRRVAVEIMSPAHCVQ